MRYATSAPFDVGAAIRTEVVATAQVSGIYLECTDWGEVIPTMPGNSCWRRPGEPSTTTWSAPPAGNTSDQFPATDGGIVVTVRVKGCVSPNDFFCAAVDEQVYASTDVACP